MPANVRSLLPFHIGERNSDNPNDTTTHHRNQEPTPLFLERWLPSRYYKSIIAATAEFIGTFMFLFFAFGGAQVANSTVRAPDENAVTDGDESHTITQRPDINILMYIALIFGFSLAVNVWIFYRVSGGLFNPAVTLGLYLIGSLTPARAILCFIAQILAGITAAAVVSAILPGPLNVSTVLGGGTSITRGVFLEMFLTTQLVFTIFMLASEKHKATYLAPIGIGLSMFIVELVGVYYTGGSVNPARSFGPCVVAHSFPGYHYIYWVGPFMGTLLAFAIYKLLKNAEYQSINPGQDFNEKEAKELNDDPEGNAGAVETPHSKR